MTELMVDLPVTLLVSENRSASFSSAAYFPSVCVRVGGGGEGGMVCSKIKQEFIICKWVKTW